MKPRFAFSLGFLTAFSGMLAMVVLEAVRFGLPLAGPLKAMGILTVPAVGVMAFLAVQNAIIDRPYAWGSFLLAAGIWATTWVVLRQG